MIITLLNINNFFYHSFIIRVIVVINSLCMKRVFVDPNTLSLATGFILKMSESLGAIYFSNPCWKIYHVFLPEMDLIRMKC